MKILLFLILTIYAEARTIKIASYNVENLFDMHRDGTEYVEYIPGHHGWSQKMLDIKLRNITEVICDLDADVIGLQEVENDNVLSQLQRSLERAGCKYRYRAITDRPDTPVHNALLSKIPIKKKRDLLVTRYGHQRSILEVVLDTSPPLRVLVNHWKSKRGPESERIPYAKALKRRLERLPKGTEYVLIGDFNSNYNESTTMSKKHNDTGGITGINNVLKTTRDNGKIVRLNDLKKGEHLNLWMDVDAGSRWSHNFFGDKEGIDTMIIPPALTDGRGWEYLHDSFGAYKPKYLFGYHGRIKRWAYKHSKHLGKGYSDHLPVVAQFSNDGNKVESLSDSERSWWEKLLGWIGIGNKKEEVKKSEPQTFVAPAPKKQMQTVSESTIGDIKTMKWIKKPVSLKGVCVIFKRGESAVIQQSPQGEAILLYRSAMQIEEGGKYDIEAYKKKRYKGLDELTDIEIQKSLGSCDTKKYIVDFAPEIMSDAKYAGYVVRGISGIINGRKITIDSVEYPIHFRKKAGRPRNGSSVKIERAQIGYYKDHMEIVVWGNSDYVSNKN